MSWINKVFITFFHKKVGEDEFLNQYYESRNIDYLGRPRRFVIYKNVNEPEKIAPSWHAWLHHLVNEIPKNIQLFPWQHDNRHLAKFSYRGEFKGDAKHSTAAYINMHEDASVGLMYELPLEVEFGKMSKKKLPKTSSLKYNRWQP
ncbi:NADH-ubiquinone oxidoreductase subunit NDUFA12 family protein [Rickettsia oklahomensis]|uniref:NADH-ubiquinone oxidoreductase subunit NDUFA12 family protein n=1 Tax=Rickettsia oklahomensis TaxID=3141789 RepID=A0AAU7BX55_9RICK